MNMMILLVSLFLYHIYIYIYILTVEANRINWGRNKPQLGNNGWKHHFIFPEDASRRYRTLPALSPPLPPSKLYSGILMHISTEGGGVQITHAFKSMLWIIHFRLPSCRRGPRFSAGRTHAASEGHHLLSHGEITPLYWDCQGEQDCADHLRRIPWENVQQWHNYAVDVLVSFCSHNLKSPCFHFLSLKCLFEKKKK